MIKWLLGVAALSFAVSPWASELSQVESATTLIQVLDQNNKHVGHGSGFLITSEGHIATNDHVVRDAEKLKVFGGQFAKGMPARIVWQDKNLDLAVIKVTDTRQPFAALSLFSTTAEQALDVYAYGYPGTQIEYLSRSEDRGIGSPTVSKGIISRSYQSKSEGLLIQHSAEIRLGNSGGPLVNPCGQVVGINVAITLIDEDRGGGKDNFAVSASELIEKVGSRIPGIVFTGDCGGSSLEVNPPAASQVSATSEKPIQAQRSTDLNSEMLLIAIAFLVSIVLIIANVQRSRKKYENFGVAEAFYNPPNLVSDEPSALLNLSGFDQHGAPLSLSIHDGSVLSSRGYVLGRSYAFSDLAINHQRLSRAHVWITRENGVILAADLNSTNGTFLNGRRLQAFEGVAIAPGDELRLADIVLAVSR